MQELIDKLKLYNVPEGITHVIVRMKDTVSMAEKEESMEILSDYLGVDVLYVPENQDLIFIKKTGEAIDVLERI